LNLGASRFSNEWLDLAAAGHLCSGQRLVSSNRIAERLRVRAIVDAVVAQLAGLDFQGFVSVLRECAFPTDMTRSDQFTRTLDPKGFWRVDKEKDP